MSSTQAISPPYKGQNSRVPSLLVENPFCERLLNFKTNEIGISLRPGNSIHTTLTTPTYTVNNLLHTDVYNASTASIFQLIKDGSDLRWVDITSAGTGTSVRLQAGKTASEVHTLFFKNYLFYFGDGDLAAGGAPGPQYYDGSAWGNVGYSWPSSFNPFGGCVFKNRAYFIGKSSATYGYSEIDSIAGTVTKVDLSSVISIKSELRIIRQISTNQGVSANNVLAFIFSSGEVLVYQGSFPNAPDWGLDSRFIIPTPVYQNSFVDAKGDSFIFTSSQILSLRNLFMSGYDKERDEGIGAEDEARWQQLVDGTKNAGSLPVPSIFKLIQGVYDEKNDRLIINIPFYVSPTSGAAQLNYSMQYIYDFSRGGWYEYNHYESYNAPTFGIVYKDSVVYVAYFNVNGAQTVKLDGATNFMDANLDGLTYVGIEYLMKSGPLPIPKFGANAIDGVEAISISDLYPQTSYKFIADLGRQTTEAQTLPDQGSSVAKPMMNVGLQGAITTQLQISGTSVEATLGLELYAFNIWYTAGGEASR